MHTPYIICLYLAQKDC